MARGRAFCCGIVLMVAGLGFSCSRPAQILIVVDTDAPVAAQLLTDPSIAPEAVVDTVRIDRLDDDWQPTCIDDVDCTANFVLPDPSLWPFSFGVATPADGSATLHVRLRAFRGAAATPGKETIGGHTYPTIEPPVEAAIDRLIEVTLPSSGEAAVEVVLSADCLAVPASFLAPPHTCVDGDTRSGSATDGVDVVAAGEVGATRAGTWAHARAVRCSGRAPKDADAVCIPGGFSYIGEADLAGVDQQSVVQAVPPLPVVVSPFWMDRAELTVGRFRSLVNRGLTPAQPSEAPIMPDPTNPQTAGCRWLGAADSSNDDYPINCLGWDLARAACVMLGGDLPTEAQWEHAARGRGQERVYPWGDEAPQCCTTCAGLGTACTGGVGPEQIGSHPASASCGGLGDVSRDGVLDLGGNVAELCADKLVAYGQGCWQTPGIFVDPPPCESTMVDEHAARGGDWASGAANARSAFRRGDSQSSQFGFRCVYEDGAP